MKPLRCLLYGCRRQVPGVGSTGELKTSLHGGSEVSGGGSVEAMAAMMEADEVAAFMADEVLDLSQEV